MTIWGERVSPLLDVARHALLLDLDDGEVVGRHQVALPAGSGEARLAALRRHGVSTVLCGAVTQELATRAASLGVELVPFLAGEVEAVVAAYLRGQLPSDELAMPGCRGRRRRARRRPRGDGSGAESERSEVMPNRDGSGPPAPKGGAGGGRGPRGRGGRGQGRGQDQDQGGGHGQGRGQGRGRGGRNRAPSEGSGNPPPSGEQS